MCASLSLPQQKRKYLEYHDPDYTDKLGPFLESKRRCESELINTSPLLNSIEDQKNEQQICYIISREFQYEIDFKHKQLQQINDRLDNASKVLDRLRCLLVADYYRKQNPTLTPKDVISVRGEHMLFDQETCGFQLALHPSIKKILGKKPKMFKDILRTSPMRVAFQTAKKTISVKSQYAKGHEKLRRLTYKSVVIDSSKEQIANKFSECQPVQNAKEQNVSPPTRCLSLTAATKPLNASRLNNKTRHLIVVGNTSKYIGGDVDEQDSCGGKNTLTHKWLIYVQAKDINVPLERFVKKVRFFLHSSYRPNDIVDIYSSPYQIARRGWGEFPARIQIFFVESLQQKPIQLAHNLVLDKTLSGLQTLGAETLVEIWLRSDQISSCGNNKDGLSKEGLFAKYEPLPLSCTNSANLEGYRSVDSQEKDDNLFSKNAEITTPICADNEKIPQNIDEPDTDECSVYSEKETTPVTTELVNSKSKTPPNICNVCTDVGKFTSSVPHLALEKQPNRILKERQPSLIIQSPVHKISSDLKSVHTHEANCMQTDIYPKDFNTSLSSFIKLPEKTTIINKAVHRHTQLMQASATKQLLQKKLAQIVDADGNVKYIQMFVATSRVSKITTDSTSESTTTGVAANQVKTRNVMQPTFHPCVRQDSKHSSRTMELHVKKGGNMLEVPIIKYPESNLKSMHSSPVPKSFNSINDKQSRNVVFLREGKVYIIDPMQIKLKQQQTKQISLLKPQVSSLKQESNLQTPIICDHDYIPAPIMQPIINESKQSFAKKCMKAPLKHPITLPFLHSDMKELHLNANNAFGISQQELERQFLTRKFSNVRQAVEYLLRRLPLIAKSTTISQVDFPYLNNSLQHFNALPVFKRKAFEWLRSKLIANLLRAHDDLQKTNKPLESSDGLWSTREIITFARFHVYTPPIMNLLPRLHTTKSLNKNKTRRGITRFTDLIKSELNNDDVVLYETITKNVRIYNWIEGISKKSSLHQVTVPENQIIEIITIDHRTNYRLKQSVPHTFCDGNDTMYLSYPGNLSGAFELVAKICKDAGMCLQHEELSCGVMHPVSQTLLSTCLRLFVEKLLRLTLGFKAHKHLTGAITLDNNSRNYIEPQDIGKVISSLNEFDFLSNCHLGTLKSCGFRLASDLF